MSLDISLRLKGHKSGRTEPRIFVRKNGRNVEISRDEWDKLNPGRVPYMLKADPDSNEVWSGNITGNLHAMAKACLLDECMWGANGQKAKDLIWRLRSRLDILKLTPRLFQLLNPKNGWGTYEVLVEFVEEYLAACEKYPNADVEVST